MNAHDVLRLYYAMVETAEKMLVSVQEQDWDRFTDLVEIVSKNTSVLQENEPRVSMNEKEIGEKKTLIEKFLAIDSQVKAIVESNKAELAKMIESTATRDKINHRYGSLRTQ